MRNVTLDWDQGTFGSDRETHPPLFLQLQLHVHHIGIHVPSLEIWGENPQSEAVYGMTQH